MASSPDAARQADYADFVVGDDEPQRTAQIVRFCCLTVPFFEPGWADASPDAFAVTELSGGITNKLYRVQHRPSNTSAVARVFGKETGRIISRASELFYQSRFIPTYGKGSTILTYQFLEGYRALDATELRDAIEPVAESLAAFHVTATLASQQDVDVATGRSRLEREANHAAFTLTDWVDAALSPGNIEQLQKGRAPGALFHLGARDAAAALLTYEAALQAARPLPVGVCHNDLLAGNIMVRGAIGAVSSAADTTLIDFEYARKNGLLFDLGNHLNEYAGTDCDYEAAFPDEGHVALFVAAYRRHMRARVAAAAAAAAANAPARDPTADPAGEDAALVAFAVRLFGPGGADFFAPSDAAETDLVQAWTRHVLFYSVVSNLGWGVWALLQAAYSDIDFDFFAYAKARYDRHTVTAARYMADR